MEGRRKEFAHFKTFAVDAVPSPQDEETFRRSALKWEERGEERHARTLAIYKRALALGRTDPVFSHDGEVTATAEGAQIRIMRRRGNETREIVWDLAGATARVT